MTEKQTRDDDFLAKLTPRIRGGAPQAMLDAVGKLRYAIWINTRTDITLRILESSFRCETPGLADKAFHVVALELQDAAVTKLDALYDKKPARVCIPTIFYSIRNERLWLDTSKLTIDMLLRQIEERLNSAETIACQRRIGRWRNEEAGHIAWITDRFRETIYEEIIKLQGITSCILRDLARLVFGIDLTVSYPYRQSLAEAMRDQLLQGRRTQG